MRVIISDVDMGGTKTYMVSREYLARLVVMLENSTPLPEPSGPTPVAADAPVGACEHGYLQSKCPMCNHNLKKAARR